MLTGIVYSVAADRTIVSVEQLVAQLGVGKRALQRLFHEYVTLSRAEAPYPPFTYVDDFEVVVVKGSRHEMWAHWEERKLHHRIPRH